jgi:hypothetical protein
MMPRRAVAAVVSLILFGTNIVDGQASSALALTFFVRATTTLFSVTHSSVFAGCNNGSVPTVVIGNGFASGAREGSLLRYSVQLSCNPFPSGVLVIPSETGSGSGNVTVSPAVLYFVTPGSWNVAQTVSVQASWDDAVATGSGRSPLVTLSHFVHRPTDGYGGWDATARVPFYVFGAWAVTRGAVAL